MIDIFLTVFILSMLFHELMHIKGQHILNTGKIIVKKAGMVVYPDNVHNGELLYASGGLLTSILLFYLVFRSSGWWQFAFFANGWVQLIYGLLEWKMRVVGKLRYLVYVLIPIICLIFWMVM